MARPKGSTLKSKYGKKETPLKMEVNNQVIKKEIMPDQVVVEKTTVENIKASDNIPTASYSPFDEEVESRDYTKEMIKNQTGEISKELLDAPIAEPVYNRPNFGGGNSNPKPQTINTEEQQSPNLGTEGESVSTVPIEDNSTNPKLDDLSPGQKRSAAKKTADALIKTYSQVMPYPFIKMGSFNIRKLNKMEANGEIRMMMPVTEDGTTLSEFAEETNAQIQDTLRITEDMQEELREPLIEVLLENNMALTPTQRLIFVAVSQVVAIGSAGIQLALQKRDAMENFKEWRSEELAKGVVAQPVRPIQQQQTPIPPVSQEKEEAISDATEQIYEAPIISEETNYEKPTFGMDDYLNGTVTKGEDFDNTGVTIEEEIND